MAILLVSVGLLDATVAALTEHPLMWVRWIPGLIPFLAPLTIWEVFRDSAKSSK
jgi:hypothetical protein